MTVKGYWFWIFTKRVLGITVETSTPEYIETNVTDDVVRELQKRTGRDKPQQDDMKAIYNLSKKRSA